MAHHFPPAPGYGSPYGSGPSFYSPYHPGMVQQHTQTPPGMPQHNVHNQGGYQQPNVNVGRFDANAQFNTSGPSIPFPPATFPSDMFKQFANSNMPLPPPPSHPPIPLPEPLSSTSVFPFQPNHPLPTTPRPNGVPHSLDGTVSSSIVHAFSPPGPPATVQRSGSASTFQPQTISSQAQPAKARSVVPPYPSNTGTPLSVEKPNDKPAPELRQLAKGALLSLAPHNIHYSDLVKEGIDPSILQNLYGELGLKAYPTPVARASQTLQPSHVPSSGTSVPGLLPTDQAVQANTDETPIDRGNSSVKGLPIEDKVPSTNLVPEAGIQSSLGKPLSAPSPNLERKDRIAQLLAAKRGHPSPSRSASESASPVVASESLPLPVHSAQGRAHEPDEQVAVVSTAQDTQARDVSRNIKIKAQTELVRQKMEQLRREALVRSQPNESEAATTASGVTLDPMSQPPKPQDVTSLPTWSTLSTPIREQVVRSGLTSMIPGLFLTAADPDSDAAGSATIPKVSSPTHQEPVSVSAANGLRENINPTQALEQEVNPDEAVSQDDLVSPRLPMKRAIETDNLNDQSEPNAKRLHREEISEPNAVEMDLAPDDPDDPGDTASEGEILEDGDSSPEDPSAAQLVQTASNIEPPTELAAADVLEVPQGGLYRAKQSEIEAMRRKIAEMEQRKQGTRGSSQVNLASTSSPDEAIMEQSSANSTISTAQSRLPAGRMISKLTPSQLAERAAALKADLLRQRAQRQRVLQEGLPDLDAEVHKTRSKMNDVRNRLNQVRQEAANFEAEALRARGQEQELLNEIARLENQLQRGLSGQKQYSDELHHLEAEQQPGAQTMSTIADAIPSVVETANTLSQPDNNLLLDTSVMTAPESEPLADIKAGPIHAHGPLGFVEVKPERADPVLDHEGQNLNPHQKVVQEPFENPAIQHGEEQVEAANDYGPTAVEMDTSATVDVSVSTEEEEQPYWDQNDVGSRESPMEIDDDSDGSASMSDSGSEDDGEYEPADIEAPQAPAAAEDSDDEYDPETTDVIEPQNVLLPEEDEVDDYEPAEDIEMIETPSYVGVDEPVEENAALPAPPSGSTLLGEHPPVQTDQNISQTSPETKTDDTENGLQLSEAQTLFRNPEPTKNPDSVTQALIGSGTSPASRFVPYQTPLRSFKSYRFHPNFHDTVKNGYRSLTYSNKIDWKRPLCPTELLGETCTDPTCEEQHFRQLGLADDKILVQMSNTADIPDKIVRDRYLVGLKKVIAELRQKGVKEFDDVADALSAYRRQFFAEQELS